MASTVCKASSANDGFFQALPVIPNQFHDDVSFRRALKLFLPRSIIDDISPELERFGQEVLSKRIFDWVTDAEKNVPYLRGGGRDAFGRKTSELMVGEGWRKLQEFGIENGIVAAGYEGRYAEYTRVVQFLRTHLWTGSCGNVTCPSAMSDGAAKLLSTQLAHPDLDPTTRRVFQDAYDHLTSRNPAKAWTSGQWMTERTGGSDVSGTETVATCSPSPEDMSTPETPLGPWSIDGFKWFSSATDSSMTVLLARTPKGLSTFFAPIHRTRGIPTNSASLHEKELNGIFISRLKNKFGTKSLPTAELELSGTRGYLIGKEGQGIQEISTILNISRLYSAFSALGYVGRGLAIAKGFAKVREVGAGRGKRVILKNAPLHMQTLANITGEYQSMMLFTYFIAWLMGITEHTSRTLGEGSGPRTPLRPDNPSDIPFLLRILTPVLKASVCKRSIHALQECMEALGGVGYLDNTENESINIARLYRDCCVLSIWEGTTDVLASDTLRVLKGRNGDEVIAALDRWISKGLNNARPGAPVRGTEKLNISHSWRVIRDKVRAHTAEEQIPFARHLLFEIADVVMGVLLIVDAESDMDVAATSVCTRFLSLKGITPQHAHIRDWPVRDGLELNQKIVYGGTADTVFASRSKL